MTHDEPAADGGIQAEVNMKENTSVNDAYFFHTFGEFTTNATQNYINETKTSLLNSQEDPLPLWFNVLYFILRLIQGFVSLSANLLTIIAIVKFPELRNICSNYFIASLAVTDALSGLLPFIQIGTVYIFDRNTQSWVKACYFELFLNLSSTFGNLYGMLVISIDRFIYIQWPLKYYVIATIKRCIIVIMGMWTIISVKLLLSLGFGSQLNSGTPCRWSLVLIFELYKYLMQTQFYVITAVLVFIYVLIGMLVIKLNKQIGHMELHQDLTGKNNTCKQTSKKGKENGEGYGSSTWRVFSLLPAHCHLPPHHGF